MELVIVRRRITWMFVLLTSIATPLLAQDRQLPVVMVFAHDPNSPGVQAFVRPFQQYFLASTGIRVQFHDESIRHDHFPDRQRWPEIARDIAQKHEAEPPAAIVTEGSAALEFAVEHLRPRFPGTPIIYALSFDPNFDYSALPTNVTGRQQHASFSETLVLAKRLQPDAERVVLIGGASVDDSTLVRQAQRQLEPMLGGMELIMLRNWTYPELLQQLRRLPPRTIAIFTSIGRDRLGYMFNSGDLIPSVTTVASAPVYGGARPWVGNGIVGGAVLDFGDEGKKTAELLERVLRLPRNAQLPSAEEAANPVVVDAQEMQRWGLSFDRLPPGTQVINREPTLWQRYWRAILATIAIVAAQLALIVWMLVERNRRRRAQREVKETRDQVTHIARVATAGQLTAALSHELRQPLAAIDTLAGAGQRLLQHPEPDTADLREIFGSIRAADREAIELINHIRGMMRNEGPRGDLVDLNRVCLRTIDLLARQVDDRGVRLECDLAADLSPVRGDEIQLQQVAMNLILNALDAAADAKHEKLITIGTRERNIDVEMYVRNTGPPISAEVQDNLFTPFYSTKPEGLGMGLAIVRMIVLRHDGAVNGSIATRRRGEWKQ
jgi:signal transduction histidine kinase